MPKSLPVGSVIKLTNFNEKFVVIGKFVSEDGKYFDYRCVKYPFGFIGEIDENNFYFNVMDKDVEFVYHLGNVNYKEDDL